MVNTKVYVIEVESGSSYEGGAMVFDSVWSDRGHAETYAKQKFANVGGYGHDWDYSITEYYIDMPS